MLEELDQRTGDGLTVTLSYVPSDKAADAFKHPFLYEPDLELVSVAPGGEA